MHAAVLHQQGEAPAVEEFTEPQPKDGATVVTVLAAGLNPVDLAMASGAMGPLNLPLVVGNDGVGRLPDGRRVYFERTVAPFGSIAEKALATTDATIPLPDDLDDGAALTLGIPGLAGWVSLEWRAALQPGEPVLVLGTTGVVGQVAAQAAKLLGAGRVVGAGHDARTLDLVRQRSADDVVTLQGNDNDTKALQDAAGDGYDVIIDTVYGQPLEAALGAVARGARSVTLGRGAGDKATIPASVLMGKGLSILSYSNMTAPAGVKRAAYERMVRHTLAGELVIEVQRFALADAAEAWRQQSSSPHKKLVIVP